MFKNILFILMISILLSGCNNQTNNDNNEAFNKKQECAKYFNEIENWNKQYNRSESGANSSSSIGQIFYSKSLNTCVFTRSSHIAYKNDIGKTEINYRLLIEDVLTHDTIWSSSIITNGEGYSEKELEFNNKIKELKGE